jgi:hypothetical protein
MVPGMSKSALDAAHQTDANKQRNACQLPNFTPFKSGHTHLNL